MFIIVAIWGLAMAVTGFAIYDLTGNEVASYAAAALPLLFAVTGLMPNGAWALPALAVVWALGARALPPQHHALPPTPVAVVASPATG